MLFYEGYYKLAKQKREEATCSFHYLVREKRNEGKDPEIVPFTEGQFKAFCDKLLLLADLDLDDDETCKHLKVASNAPVEKCEMINDRTVFGRFRSLYSGHAYDNTDVGEIPHSSVSLRPFFFLAYLSESGRIYVGSQYLGQFGGYMGLFRTLRQFLPETVVSHSFRNDRTSYQGAKPEEVRVNFSRQPKEITGATKFGQRGAMAFKQSSSKDEQFHTAVSTNILAKLGQPDAMLKKAVASMLTGNEMLSLRDDDIEDCTVIAMVDGKRMTINVIEAGHFATRFPLDIAEYINGHPDKEKSKAAMLNLLKNQIIKRNECV